MFSLQHKNGKKSKLEKIQIRKHFSFMHINNNGSEKYIENLQTAFQILYLIHEVSPEQCMSSLYE